MTCPGWRLKSRLGRPGGRHKARYADSSTTSVSLRRQALRRSGAIQARLQSLGLVSRTDVNMKRRCT